MHDNIGLFLGLFQVFLSVVLLRPSELWMLPLILLASWYLSQRV